MPMFITKRGVVAPPPVGGLLAKNNLARVGFIKVPDPTNFHGVSKFGGAGFAQGLAFNPAGNGGLGSLLVAGVETDTNIGGPVLAEISIPTPGATRAGAPTASFLSNFYSSDEGAIDAGNPRDNGFSWHAPITRGGCVVYNSKIYDTNYINYDGSGTPGNAFIHRRPVNLATTGQVEGPLGPNASAGFVAGSLALIPPNWQSSLGNKKLMSSLTGISITSRTSQGPSLNIFDPADSSWTNGNYASSSPLIYTPVASYSIADPPSRWLAYYDASLPGQIASYPSADPWVEPEPFWSGGTYMGHGLLVLDDYRTVLAIYTVGLSRWNYGLGINTYITGQEAQGIFPPNPPVEALPPASWDSDTSGQLVATNGAGTRLTIPFLTYDNSLPGGADDLPIDGGRNIWLKNQSNPVQNLGSKCAERHGVAHVIGKGNKGLSNAFIDVDVPFLGNLTVQPYTLGKPAIYDPNNLGQGNHAPPYRTCAYAYDINDLAAVVSGSKQAYNVLPYALYNLDEPFLYESSETPGGGHPYLASGAAIDHTNKRIYFLRPSGEPSLANTAIIVVLRYN